jgi:toxin-antitoxin system PIN domain toxin
MRSLLDVNVLIALLDADHALHEPASRWFKAHADEGWASCPITQNGCVRVMANAGYPNPLPVRAVVERLGEATAHRLHEFWPDDVSVLDASAIDSTRIHGPRQLTDAFLLALAVAHKGRLATFDRSVPVTAVPGAQARHLAVI